MNAQIFLCANKYKNILVRRVKTEWTCNIQKIFNKLVVLAFCTKSLPILRGGFLPADAMGHHNVCFFSDIQTFLVNWIGWLVS
jgi:hypothetical protein